MPACTATTPHPPAYSPLRTACPSFDSAVRVGVQPAAELRRIQRHRHGKHVLGTLRACPGPHDLSWASSPRACRRPTPSRLPACTSAHIVRPPFDSAARAGVQPAAELGHIQRHEHGRHVCGGCPCPQALILAFPVHAACATANLPPSRLPARTSPRIACPPLTRQDAPAFNRPLSFNTSSVTNMGYMFNVRSARAPPPANLESGLPRACRLRRPPSHALPPHALQARTSPRMHRTPSLRLHSAGRVGLQPAAELRHVQRHDHVQHVLRALRACPVPQALSRAFPRACPLAPPPHTLPPPDPCLACALLLTRQGAWAFNQPLSFDTAKVTGGAGMRFTGMRYMFRVRPARALVPEP
jgi:hypothetical protein